jgi:hypothetical protein
MKRIIFIALILLFTSGLYAQKDSSFYKQDVKISFGGAVLPTLFWNIQETYYVNFSVAYLHYPIKWFGVGGNIVNYFGERLYYNVREYNNEGKFRDFTLSKIKYCIVVAPEFRFSYLNRRNVMLYSGLSAGIGWEFGYDNKNNKYPKTRGYFHNTFFGFSYNFGQNKNIFLGGEVGMGWKGLFNIHGGYKF